MNDAAGGRRIVYVLGPGRSGTSTVAGALCMSGLAVPGRAIGGNETNPVGFYEPRWVVDLHKRLLDRAVVGTLDPDPTAYDQVQSRTVSRHRQLLRSWLEQRLDEQPHLVVKDPRGVWFKDLWSDVAAELGVEIGFLTMLRHPAEVSGSRQRYYSKASGERPLEDVTRIGGWLNVALTAERVTRGAPRVFVRYTDLIGEWRPVLTRISDQLHLELDPSPQVRPHPVDDFIDPALHRVRVEWDDLSLPHQLRDLGERAWQTLSGIADRGEDDASLKELDVLREEFATFSEQALALHRQTMRRVEVRARRKARAQASGDTTVSPSDTSDDREGRTGKNLLGRLGIRR